MKKIFTLIFISFLLLAACNSSSPQNESIITPEKNNDQVPSQETTKQNKNTGYLGPEREENNTTSYPPPLTTSEQTLPAYPGSPALPDDISAEPPNPKRNLPAPVAGAGTIGGVLVREVTEGGFTPVTPLNLYLGNVLEDSKGRQALLAWSENSPKATLLPTGIFIFNNVAPGTYGLVIDLGFSQFPLTSQDGSDLLITVEAGQALDLGQIFVTLPNQ